MSAPAPCMVCDGNGRRYVEGTGPVRCVFCRGTGLRVLDPESEYGKAVAEVHNNAHRILEHMASGRVMDPDQADDLLEDFFA